MSNTTSANLSDPQTTSLQLYSLLGLQNPAVNPATPHPDASTIRRAYRKASLLVHPDKAPPEKKEEYSRRFHELTIAYDILADDTKREIYIARLEREYAQKREREAYGAKRRKMMDDLERQERGGREGFLNRDNGGGDGVSDGWKTPEKPQHAGVKRTHSGIRTSTPLSAEQSREMQRLAAEGARKRAEFEERRRKKRQSGVDGRVDTTPLERPDGAPLSTNDATVNGPSTPTRSNEKDTNGKMEAHAAKPSPSFSFTPRVNGATKEKSQGAGAGPGAPGGSLFESTMAKLREAQRRKEERAREQNAESTAA